MSDETRYCSFCDSEATHIIDRSLAPICTACLAVYQAGQSNPDGEIEEINDVECP